RAGVQRRDLAHDLAEPRDVRLEPAHALLDRLIAPRLRERGLEPPGPVPFALPAQDRVSELALGRVVREHLADRLADLGDEIVELAARRADRRSQDPLRLLRADLAALELLDREDPVQRALQ